MSRPTPGKQYTVVVGDTLSEIAGKAYGDVNKWPIIFKANQTELKSSDPNLIFPGEIIFIPVLSEVKAAKDALAGAVNRAPDEMVIEIGGFEIPIQSGSIIRTMDTVADAWSCNIAWVPGADENIDRITAPYSYSLSKAFIGNQKLVEGRLYQVAQRLSNEGQSKTLMGFSYTADLIDSTLKPPYEKEKVTLLQRARDLVTPLGINVIVDAGVEIGGVFDRVTAKESDKIFTHLNKLARQRSLLISSTENGDFLITKANTKGVPIGDITEGQPGEQEFSASFDGRKRFNTYRVLAQGGDKFDEIFAVAKDSTVPTSRFLTFSANDVSKGEVKSIANWQRSKQLANALTIPFPVSSWYAPSGKLWRENELVSVTSETIGAPNGFTFLIRQVEYKFENDGRPAILSLVPPQVYTNEPIEEPWR